MNNRQKLLYWLSVIEADRRKLIEKTIATTNVDEKGRFSVTLGILKPRERVSAIATHPDYDTSEPALNIVLRSCRQLKVILYHLSLPRFLRSGNLTRAY
jgi:hypothetical protein